MTEYSPAAPSRSSRIRAVFARLLPVDQHARVEALHVRALEPQGQILCGSERRPEVHLGVLVPTSGGRGDRACA